MIRPRSSMITTASNVASSRASTSEEAPPMPRKDTPCAAAVGKRLLARPSAEQAAAPLSSSASTSASAASQSADLVSGREAATAWRESRPPGRSAPRAAADRRRLGRCRLGAARHALVLRGARLLARWIPDSFHVPSPLLLIGGLFAVVAAARRVIGQHQFFHALSRRGWARR